MRPIQIASLTIVIATVAPALAEPRMVIGERLAGVGWPQQLTHGAHAFLHSVSPDGKWVAYFEIEFGTPPVREDGTLQSLAQRVRVVPASGGTPRVLVEYGPEVSVGRQPSLLWDENSAFLAVGWLATRDDHRGLVVFDTRDWRTMSVGEGTERIRELEWQPGGRALLYLAVGSSSLFGTVRIWDPVSGRTQQIGIGTSPEWTEDGRRVRYHRGQPAETTQGMAFRIEGTVECDPVTGAETLSPQGSIPRRALPERLVSADGNYVAETKRDPAASGWGSILTVTDAESGKQQVASREAMRGFQWARQEPLLLFSRMLLLRDDVRNDVKGNLDLVWVFNPERPKDNTLFIGVQNGSDAQWVGRTRKICYLFMGEVWLSEITSTDPTLDERAQYGLALTDEQKFQIAEAKMRDVAAALKNAVAGVVTAEATMRPPEGARRGMDDEVLPYLRNNDSLAAPGGEALVSFLIQPGQTVLGRANPQGVPLAFLAWPRGYVFAAFLDGSVRRFTDAEWDVFSADAKAAGNWPPDWND